jgi:hypothetical protein
MRWFQGCRSISFCALSFCGLAALFPGGGVYAGSPAQGGGQPIHLQVDLTDAPRNIYHAKLKIPATPGAMTLVFPKWIPGNHRPSGPINGLTGLRMAAAGKPLVWQRDEIDMYAFHVNVPEGVEFIDVSLDAITSNDSAGGGGPAASSNLLDLNWNAVVLYPQSRSHPDGSMQRRCRPCCGIRATPAIKCSSPKSHSLRWWILP